MKRKVTCVTSMALAVLMLGSSVLSGGLVSAFAANGDFASEPIRIEQGQADGIEIVEDDVVVVDAGSDDDEIKIQEAEQTIGASVSIAGAEQEEDGIAIEGGHTYASGESVPLHIEAFNKQKEDAVFRLYFWDYEKELPEDSDAWDELLTVPCTDIVIQELDEDRAISVDVISDKNTISEKAVLVQEDDDTEAVSCYLELDLPAGTSVDFNMEVSLESTDAVTIIPTIAADEEEIYFDSLLLCQDDKNEIYISEVEVNPVDIDISNPDGEIPEDIDDEASIVIMYDEEDADIPIATLLTLPDEDEEEYVADTFDLKLDETEDTEDLAEEKLTDPILEAYIREHADPAYTDVDTLELVNMLLVKQTIADASMLDPDDTIDSVMYSDKSYEAVWTMLTADVAVYNLSEDSEYLVAFADTMHDDAKATPVDAVFAVTNYKGEVVDGIFDYETGLAYIPKAAYIDEDGTNHIYEVQMQILQAVDFSNDDEMISAFSVATETDGEIEQEQDSTEVFELTTNVQTETGLDKEDMTVSVNGLPLSEEEYDYNGMTGVVTIAEPSVAVQSVYVDVKDETVLDKIVDLVSPAKAYAAYVAPDNMESVASITWNGGLPAVGSYYPINLYAQYLTTFDHKFEGTYGLGEGGVITDSSNVNLFWYIYNGTNVDVSKLVKQNTYEQWRVWLNSCTGLPFTVDSMYRSSVTFKCAHITSNPYGYNSTASAQVIPGGLRVLYVNSTAAQPYMLLGMIGKGHTGGQSPSGIIKVDFKMSTVDLTITKRSMTDLSAGRGEMRLTGAVFELYGWTGTGYQTYVATSVDNGDGTYTFKNIELSKGSGGHFLVKEKSAPAGYYTKYYNFNTQDAINQTGYGGRQFVYENGAWSCNTLSDFEYPFWGFVFLDECKSVNFKVTKVDADTNKKLTGAEFTLYGWNSTTSKYDIDLGKFTDNGDGTYTSPTFYIDRGENRKYLVKETKAPANYNLSSANSTDSDFKTYGGRQITLDANGNITGSPNLTFANKQKSGYLKLKKVSALPDITDNNQCYSLEGAKYGVYSDAACKTSAGTLTTTADGSSNTLTLQYGTYYVKETEASKGYELDETVYKVVIEAGKTTTVNSENGGTVEEYPGNDPTGVQITKIWNGEETPTIPSLEGTQFTIKYYDGYYTEDTLPSTATRTWVFEVKKSSSGIYWMLFSEDYLVESLSDELYYVNGFPTLPLGTITIQETKPAVGYTLKGYLTNKQGTTIATDSELYVSQVKQGENYSYLFGGNEYMASDTPIFGSIKIKKYDTDGRTALQGVTFEIVNSAGETVATKITNANGEILFDNLYPDVYTITETATVSGHTLLKDPITAEIPMRVTEQDIKDNNIDKNQCIYDAADDIYYIHNLTYEVGNSATFAYPMTGGFDTMWTYLPLIAGLMVLAGMSAVMFRRKRGN